MNIVLDTNIIVADPWLRGNTFKILLENFERVGHSLFTPIIVIDEATNIYRKNLSDTLEKYKNNIDLISKSIRQNLDDSQIDIDIEKLTQEYNIYLHQELKCNRQSSRYIFYPDVSHHQVVERALKRRKPFSEKGRGYQDALIWYGILSTIETYDIENEPIAFISQNTSDFAGCDNQLHIDLVRDLIERSLEPDCVIFYPSLKLFVEDQITRSFDKLSNLQKQLNIGGEKEEWFRKNFIESLFLELKNYKITQVETAFPKALGNLEILEVDELLDYSVSEVRRSNVIRASYVVLEVSSRVVCKVSAVLNELAIIDSNFLNLKIQSIKNIDNNYPIIITNITVSVLGVSIYYENEGISVETDTVIALECL
ncbi:PIN domain-containing protein [Chamaesiphon sp. OTE_8_metabat_110]|uniref:PIN domain-containing protein n=1 Tax=Chamaesiphon sp. OTE_8_metabat_110 TaxID=2964696 RepID=UPI00286C7F0F|nr:PIN domain-containing protein [Chamaesiphon sp. OTE_8_metabat_110]